MVNEYLTKRRADEIKLNAIHQAQEFLAEAFRKRTGKEISAEFFEVIAFEEIEWGKEFKEFLFEILKAVRKIFDRMDRNKMPKDC